MPATGNEDIATSTEVIDPLSNNPTSIQQTSTLFTEDNGGLNENEFCVSVNLATSNVTEQVNIAIVIDVSGSTGGTAGGDFPDSIFNAELDAAQALFEEYVAAGYDPSEVNISLVTYNNNANVVGNFTLDQEAAFDAAVESIRNDPDLPGGSTNYVGALDGAGDAFAAIGADPVDDTNIVVFLSDGRPVPFSQQLVPPGGTTTPIEDAASDLESGFNANISGIGVGPDSSLRALNQLDNTTGANRVDNPTELAAEIVAPLTDAELLEVIIEIEGTDSSGNPTTQTITLDASDSRIVETPTGFDIVELPIDPEFDPGQDVEVKVTSVWAPDPGGTSGNNQTIVTEHDLQIVVCFTRGTLIMTTNGAVKVEDLATGDRVVTRDHGAQPIRWIGQTKISGSYAAANKRLRPVLIKKDALGPNQPERDMRVSRQHRILVRDWRAEMMFGDPEGVLVPAFALCNDNTIVEERPTEEVVYIHIAFDNHEVVYADGVEAESFHPAARTVSGLNKDQRAELLEIFPDLATGDAYAYHAARNELRGRDARVLTGT